MERGAVNNLIIAHAQVWGMYIALGAMIYFIHVILHGDAKLDQTTEKLAYTVLGVFLAKFGDMIAYLYNRQRPDSPGTVLMTTPPPAVEGPGVPKAVASKP